MTSFKFRIVLYLGLSQDSSSEWQSDPRFIFLDENPSTYAVLCALSEAVRFFGVWRYLVALSSDRAGSKLGWVLLFVYFLGLEF